MNLDIESRHKLRDMGASHLLDALEAQDDAVCMGILNDLAGQGNVILERMGGTVDHNGGETAVDAGLTGLEIGAVVQMQGDGDLGKLHKIGVIGICAGALRNLQDKRCFFLTGSFRDALYDFHIVDVESADSIAASIRFLEHFGRGNQCHSIHSF